MLALEILNLKIIEQVLNSENREKLYEAINELEDLQNRSCKNCKFGIIYHFDDEVECFKIEADTQGMYFSNDFCCNKWEQNDTK